MSAERHEQVRRFAAGRIASKREELEHLRERVRFARMNYEQHRNHGNEIAKLYAENDLDVFLAANPGLGAS